MKLRLAANSLRLRILRSELATLEGGGTLQESVRLAAGTSGSITYALSVSRQEEGMDVQVSCQYGNVHVALSRQAFERWRQPARVGIYAQVETGTHVPLQVAIEKDFACLDAGADNHDTFEHPQTDAVC